MERLHPTLKFAFVVLFAAVLVVIVALVIVVVVLTAVVPLRVVRGGAATDREGDRGDGEESQGVLHGRRGTSAWPQAQGQGSRSPPSLGCALLAG